MRWRVTLTCLIVLTAMFGITAGAQRMPDDQERRDAVTAYRAGQQFMAISAGPLDPFNHAISFVVNCTNQEEVDEYWDKLSAGGTVELIESG